MSCKWWMLKGYCSISRSRGGCSVCKCTFLNTAGYSAENTRARVRCDITISEVQGKKVCTRPAKEVSSDKEQTFDAFKKVLWSTIVSIQFDHLHIAGRATQGTSSLYSAQERKSEKWWEFEEAFSSSPEAVFFFLITSSVLHSNKRMQWRLDRKGIQTDH